MWLLIIEDEVRLVSTLKSGLEEEGYIVDVAYDGEEGETLAMNNAYDALLVDWRLPKQDGKTIIEHLRGVGRNVPILMLTALSDVDHRVAGLDAGADDYLPKPFKFEELLARLRALLRRPHLSTDEHLLKRDGLEMDTRQRRVLYKGKVLDLRPKEFSFLEELLRHPDEILSRTVIAERVWGDIYFVSDNVIDVTVSSLRHKLYEVQAVGASPKSPLHIETVRGMGYRLVSSDAS
jgi:DNA-binding response OmpR family regulator